MQQLRIYGDSRTLAFCAFCGGKTGTRDHCPSRVFLDEPYPENLPVVPACFKCNVGFSADEEYLACLLSCVIAGTTDPDAMPREKTKRILKENPYLRARIEQASMLKNDRAIFTPEHQRVSVVATKLAQGHALYELHESCSHAPSEIQYFPLSLLDDVQREAFENPEPICVFPEVGSRALQRLVIESDAVHSGWIEAQPGRYRFHATQGSGVNVRIVIHEYLACHVHWGY